MVYPVEMAFTSHGGRGMTPSLGEILIQSWYGFGTVHRLIRKWEIRSPKGAGGRPGPERCKGSLGHLWDISVQNFNYLNFLSQAVHRLPREKITSLETRRCPTRSL